MLFSDHFRSWMCGFERKSLCLAHFYGFFKWNLLGFSVDFYRNCDLFLTIVGWYSRSIELFLRISGQFLQFFFQILLTFISFSMNFCKISQICSLISTNFGLFTEFFRIFQLFPLISVQFLGNICLFSINSVSLP